jgi:hypothetical protein
LEIGYRKAKEKCVNAVEIDRTEILKVRNLEQESLDGKASFKGGQGSTSGCRAIEEEGGEEEEED